MKKTEMIYFSITERTAKYNNDNNYNDNSNNNRKIINKDIHNNVITERDKDKNDHLKRICSRDDRNNNINNMNSNEGEKGLT